MAKITVEFDTKDKTLVVKKNEKKLSNVVDINFYRSWEDDNVFRAQVTQREPSEDDALTVITTIMASADGESIETVESVKEDDGVRENISKALLRRKGQ